VRILALDAATEACSAALLDDSGLRWRHEEIGRGHAERLLAMVDELLAEAATGEAGTGEAGTPLSGVDVIAASIGPGGFTGVRITVATAQGLAFGAGLRVIPISTLEALAWDALYGDPTRSGRSADRRPVLACLDARMGEVYWGTFEGDGAGGIVAREPARVSSPTDVSCAGAHDGIGRGFASYRALAEIAGLRITAAHCRALPDARAIARLAALRWHQGAALDAADLVPLYLRDKVALTEVERAASSQCHIEKI
jgi:tRNA threonylcarbamoyladenosine biosynthesis protein TsaB